MLTSKDTSEYLLEQCARYPALRPQDLLKAMHQSVMGCGHLVQPEPEGLPRLCRELSGAGAAAEIESLGQNYCRVPLGLLHTTDLTPETFFQAFLLSAREPVGTAADLDAQLRALLTLSAQGRLPFPHEELVQAAAAWRSAGYPPCSHSAAFRAAYHPAYRILHRDFARLLPLLSAVDRRLREQGRVLLAIEGGSASGKTTLAARLAQLYDAAVFHMDDFFLRPEQRTAARLAEPGGNVDRERFFREILQPLTRGKPVRYRRYDCHTQQLEPPVEAAPKALTIIEGAYSLHPELAEHYDLSVFLRISPELQRSRIQKRNTPEMAQLFFSQWIPLETLYFDALDPAGRCDLILEVTP